MLSHDAKACHSLGIKANVKWAVGGGGKGSLLYFMMVISGDEDNESIVFLSKTNKQTKGQHSWEVPGHAFDPSTPEEESGGFL